MRGIGFVCLLACLLAGCCNQQKVEDDTGYSASMSELTLHYVDVGGEQQYPVRFGERQKLEDAWGRANWKYRSGSLFVPNSSWDYAPPKLVWGDGYSLKNNEYTTRNEVTVDTKVVWFRNWDSWVCSDPWFVEAVKSAIRDRLATEGKPDPFE
jgi:hypothetical protein